MWIIGLRLVSKLGPLAVCRQFVSSPFYSARFLILNIHPVGVGVIFPIIAALGVFYSLSFLFKTGCTDPGILPRAPVDEIEFMQSLGDVGE